MLHFCTLFDSNYLMRALAMYESLKANLDEFHLYMYPFDCLSHDILRKLDLPCVTVVDRGQFEDDELLEAKRNRSAVEYFWTCTPSIIKHSILCYGLDSCIYLDADLRFYGDPTVLLGESPRASVLITPHRYTPKYDQSATSGKYCVQFMFFKNDQDALDILAWWRDRCNEWCYNRFEDGKFGDQKYLDSWPESFNGVHVLEHLGGGVAPWNVQQYSLEQNNGEIFGVDNLTGNTFDLIFYHFHSLKILLGSKVDCGNFRLSESIIDLLYIPYAKRLVEIAGELSSLGYDVPAAAPFSWRHSLRRVKRLVAGVRNIRKLPNNE